VSDFIEHDGEYSLHTSEGMKKVTDTTCGCVFNSSMLLPCRHVFALRRKLDKPLYDPSICDKRWTTTYYKSTQRIFLSSDTEPSLTLKTSSKHIRKLSQHQKFREASIITAELASIASYASSIHFQR